MPEVLKGTISNALGLREALEQVTAMKQINSGVLEISGPVAGRMGIAWGRFITGAVAGGGKRGRLALRQLLSAKEGDFVFLDKNGEPVDELRQNLGIDLNGVVPYVPDELTLTVTPWLFDQYEHATPVTVVAVLPAIAPTPAATPEATPEAPTAPVEERADRVLAQLQSVIGEAQPSTDLETNHETELETELEKDLSPSVITLITTAQSALEDEPVDRTRDMEPVLTQQRQASSMIPDAARVAYAVDSGSRAQRQRAANHPGREGRDGGDTVGIAILCVLFFVVSCAGTVIFGPRIAAVVTSAFHATH